MNKLLKQQANEKKKPQLTELEKAYKRVFGSTDGRVVLEDLKKSLGFGKTLFHTNQPNGDLHFHLGRQSVINEINYTLNKEG